jgi:hypothetical protein
MAILGNVRPEAEAHGRDIRLYAPAVMVDLAWCQECIAGLEEIVHVLDEPIE